jgi:hypothetical protein
LCWLVSCQSYFTRNAVLSSGCLTGSPSSWPNLVLKKLISARRWQSGLELIRASFAGTVGAGTEQACQSPHSDSAG